MQDFTVEDFMLKFIQGSGGGQLVLICALCLEWRSCVFFTERYFVSITCQHFLMMLFIRVLILFKYARGPEMGPV